MSHLFFECIYTVARNITIHVGRLTDPPTVDPNPSSDDSHRRSSAAETELIPFD